MLLSTLAMSQQNQIIDTTEVDSHENFRRDSAADDGRQNCETAAMERNAKSWGRTRQIPNAQLWGGDFSFNYLFTLATHNNAQLN